MICARCGVTLREGYVRSKYTKRVYCKSWDGCNARVKQASRVAAAPNYAGRKASA